MSSFAANASLTQSFPVEDYNLPLTLSCGQAFRWIEKDKAWIGVVQNRWVRLALGDISIHAEVAQPVKDWFWLADSLQLHLDIREVIRTFPQDEPMQAAVMACRGLRLLRQDPW